VWMIAALFVLNIALFLAVYVETTLHRRGSP
jgi:hypothetical protein